MSKFVAHYRSPNASRARARGIFEFESDARLGSKANAHDARVKMLEEFGSDALQWTIEDIRHKASKSKSAPSDGQLELDFREPVKEGPKRRRSTKRGIV